MLSDPDYVPEEDVRIELYRINHDYKFTLSTFADLPFIKKVCKDRPTKLELRQGLERVFDAIAAHRNNTTHTLRNPASFATQTWMNALREMRLAAASLPESASSKSWASGKTERREQCRAITKAGQQCPHAAKENGLCGTHQDWPASQQVTEPGKEVGPTPQESMSAERQRHETAQQSMQHLKLGHVGESEADTARWHASESRDGAAQGADGANRQQAGQHAQADAHHSWVMKARSQPGLYTPSAHGGGQMPSLPSVPVPQPVDSQHAHSQLCAHAAHAAYAQAAGAGRGGQGSADGGFEGEHGDGGRRGGGGGHSLAPREWEEYPDVPVPKEWTEGADAATPPPSTQKISAETPRAAQAHDMSHSEGAEVTSTTSLDSHTLEVLSERRLEDLKVEELKKICRARGLAVSGTKAQLLNRLQGKPGGASTPPPEGAASLSSMRTDDLKEACRQVGSPVSGTKEQLQERVQEHNLRAAAKKAAESSYQPSSLSAGYSETYAHTAPLPEVKSERHVTEQDAAPRSSPATTTQPTPSAKAGQGMSSSSSMVGLDAHQSLHDMWTATAASSCPGINDGLVRVAAMSGGKLKTALEAKRAWHSGLKAFARVAADGPMITPEMTQVEKAYQSAMHEEACLAVDDMLRHGDPTRLRSYVTASRAVNHSGQSTEGAQINTLVVNYIRMMFTVAASGVGDGGDSSEEVAVQAMCSWMLGLVDDPNLQSRASQFVRYRVEQVAIRISDFF